MAEVMTGKCLCGAVTITIGAHAGVASACHCSMCRRWTGAVQWGFEAPVDGVEISGAVGLYRSSEFAERAWCKNCGTHLWLRDIDAAYEFVPGLFEDARDMPLAREVYADQAFACAALAGDHHRVTRAKYEASNRFVEDAR